MNNLTSNPLFSITLCILTYMFFVFLNKRTKSPFLNPLLLSIAFIIVILNVFRISLDDFSKGGDIISLFLAPATCVLAISVYKQFEILKQNFLPVLVGCLTGSIVSMTSSYLLCKAFNLDERICRSLVPKSVTTPIAMEISKNINGLIPITVAVVIVTGILGCVFSPLLIKLFSIKNPVVAGVAIGTSSHALGTSKAIELGEIEGAMSGIAIGVSGIITVILSLFI